MRDWPTAEIKLVNISNGLSNKCFSIHMRPFPIASHDLELLSEYVDTDRALWTTDLALVDLEATETAYANYIPVIMHQVLERFSGPPVGLLHRAYRQACRLLRNSGSQTKACEMLHAALSVWASVCLSLLPVYVVEETLQMAYFDSSTSALTAGKIPAPPILRAQLELVLIHYVEETLRKDLLHRLQDMLYKNRRDTWMVIYLVLLILLHNTERLTERALRYAKHNGGKVGILFSRTI